MARNRSAGRAMAAGTRKAGDAMTGVSTPHGSAKDRIPMNQRMIPVHGIILAAGRSARMGRDKLSLPFRGLPLLQHVVNAARGSGLARVSVVLQRDSGLVDLVDLDGCETVLAPPSADQAASFRAGLRAVMDDAAGCMVLHGDQPLLAGRTIDHLLWAFSQQPDYMIAPVQEDLRGAPVIVPRAWFPKALEVAGDAVVRTLVAMPGLTLRLVKIHEVGPFMGIDTELEYRRLLARHEVRPTAGSAA
ncbi:nucleotidyltransferase family protein [Desulfovibrio sulfodismutans]|uniref:Nucleotidyltransferase family protein n=1 Tax=Desulfolutivibrio sulfodismutans TaxID=63561 RepID=A0A7K3NGV5_9BACT|nr:nucleotidyltransferase family protein [Desulfolutivibrio sulfodismutans]NDY55430.1 nucleotidyltransferase family protein [Desulfolutivibrio sulfodismutans]